MIYRCPACEAPMNEETHKSINRRTGGINYRALIVCTGCGEKRDLKFDKVDIYSERINTNGKHKRNA